MKVLQILQRKGSAEIESVSPDDCLSDVATKLSEKKIGCVIILNHSGEIAGIVSERDIVRAIGRIGHDCLDHPVSSVMTSDVREGALVGLISIGDVVKARIDGLKMENEELENMIRAATA